MDSSDQNLYFSDMAKRLAVETHPSTAIPAYLLYGEALEGASERLIHIETVAARSRLHDWHIRPHRHADLHQLLLLRRGRVTATLDGQASDLATPAALVIPPGVVHSFKFRPDTVGFVVSIATDLVDELARADPSLRSLLVDVSAERIESRALVSTDVWPLCEMLLREFTRAAHGRQSALRGLLTALLANFRRLKAGTEHPDADGTGARELVARFRELLEQRLHERPSVAQYATALGVTEARLRRACVAITARTPVELIQRRVLLEAERLLRYTSMPINQIAYHLGFDDPAYFSRFVTRGTGRAPRLVRKRDGLDPSASKDS
jgi:AraC family transcriptional activator of pobA